MYRNLNHFRRRGADDFAPLGYDWWVTGKVAIRDTRHAISL